ncbi:baseplate J/gp47 family protein [Curvibacter lanceolatus]|uniref:baseplate J/gp47 family protein n=1 Tax=Curvibacter lanceolatus TaxID=86182 RepID=UPI00037CF4D3|nr:baseplate J/gp47 family protein [Curvibacter lanceolatus]
MSTTNVPSVSFTSAGVSLPLESAILAGVQADIDAAFGGGVNPDLTTPQGQLAQSMTAIIGDKNDQIAEISNQVNPDVATGRWQDALGRIYFLERVPASGTVVSATVSGVPGTVIPSGAVAQDTNGYRYTCTAEVTIGSTGSVTAQFQNLQTGPIPCAAGALSTIYAAVIGWESITNAAAGYLGTDVESRAAFETRRRASVAANATASPQSVLGKVLAVSNVVDAYVYDNPTNGTVSVGATAYPVAAHSLCVSVAGGTAADIAAAIFTKKSAGCGYTGNTSHPIEVTSGYAPPYPTYTVTWLTPTATPAYFTVQIAADDNLPGNIQDLVKAAIVSAFNGEDGGQRARIGSTTYAGRYYAGVAGTNPNVQILSILMGTNSAAQSATSLSFGIDQLPTISASNITVLLV